jgi:hypothetical protein
MRLSLLLLIVMAGVSMARATNYISGEGVAINPGFALNQAVVVAERGVLTLTAPGTYTAASWSISGELRMEAPGNYFLIASPGSFAINIGARLTRPPGASGEANLTVTPTGDYMAKTFMGERGVSFRANVVLAGLESPPLVNISTRVMLAAGQTHTSGFVVGGLVPMRRRVLVRAIGPSLGTFGVTNALAAPVLTVLNGREIVATNSGWGGGVSELAWAFFRVGAFGLPDNSRDAAVLLDLEPGNYSVQVTGGAGEVLLEVYSY